MNTEEGNKLIAVFDGYRVIENHPEYEWACTAHPTINVAAIADHQLKYHFSWDWLMPVVEKIETDKAMATMMYVNTWDNRGRYCFSIYRELDQNGSMRNRIIEVVRNSKIDATWLGVIEFIQWYNKNRASYGLTNSLQPKT